MPTAAQAALLAAVRENRLAQLRCPGRRGGLGSGTGAACFDRGWLVQGAHLTAEGAEALARYEARAQAEARP